MRFAIRRLTSMSTALVLLLLLALASVIGSLIPQRSSDPNGVIRHQRAYADLQGLIEGLQLYEVFGSVWFSAIYLLLFLSLILCVAGRIRVHAQALSSQPPKPPQRFERLPAWERRTIDAATSETLTVTKDVLRRAGYRTATYGPAVSAERGYLRETGNLLFHLALVGVLISFGLLSGFGYTGQKLLIEGKPFTNTRATFDTFSAGRFVADADPEALVVELQEFRSDYEAGTDGLPKPASFAAQVLVNDERRVLRVNEPIDVGATSMYLLGNGFAPSITVREADGTIAFSQSVPFLALDAQLTSRGVVKVPDTSGEQIGLSGMLYPTAVTDEEGSFWSVWPEPGRPTLVFDVYRGDLGLDDGVTQNAYSLVTDGLTQVAGDGTDEPSIVLMLGEEAELPGGGSVSFDALPRFIGVDISSDPSQLPTALSVMAALIGLALSLTVTRRRIWVRVASDGVVEFGGLARGDDPRLNTAVTDIANRIEGAAHQSETVKASTP